MSRSDGFQGTEPICPQVAMPSTTPRFYNPFDDLSVILAKIAGQFTCALVVQARTRKRRDRGRGQRRKDKSKPFPSTFANILCSFSLKDFWTHHSAFWLS
jgi:hypothetical protein